MFDGGARFHMARQAYRHGRRDSPLFRVYIVRNDMQLLQRFGQGRGIHVRTYAVKRKLQQSGQVYTQAYTGSQAIQHWTCQDGSTMDRLLASRFAAGSPQARAARSAEGKSHAAPPTAQPPPTFERQALAMT